MSVIEAMPLTGDSGPRKRWTRDECRRLTELGLLPEGGHYELIEGDIVDKMSQKRAHILVVTQLLRVLAAVFGMDTIQAQAPIGVDDPESDPEPDVAVLSGSVRGFADRDPDTARDVRLVVEVSDSTIVRDRTVKVRLYARAGIPEYWIVDIGGRRLIVHRAPVDDQYTDIRSWSDAESVAPLVAPDSFVRVADLLP